MSISVNRRLLEVFLREAAFANITYKQVRQRLLGIFNNAICGTVTINLDPYTALAILDGLKWKQDTFGIDVGVALSYYGALQELLEHFLPQGNSVDEQMLAVVARGYIARDTSVFEVRKDLLQSVHDASKARHGAFSMERTKYIDLLVSASQRQLRGPAITKLNALLIDWACQGRSNRLTGAVGESGTGLPPTPPTPTTGPFAGKAPYDEDGADGGDGGPPSTGKGKGRFGLHFDFLRTDPSTGTGTSGTVPSGRRGSADAGHGTT